ncbi:MAG TPA: ATP-binding protein [Candidatus Diapherotrites archaeon]|uniref:ATP-binding protein n=1 Tax=Candidatus Iainarchaeum sp. TaxID=3101447 RepID=A0A7J4IZI8_9ARCH|nr:ATP-binding protein [Candidatus Diapherotrites archaeon]
MNGIRDALLLQKRELEKYFKEAYMERDEKLAPAKDDLIRVIIGPRRAGKSFFVMHALKIKGKFGYANFDDEQLIKTDNFDELLAIIDSLYGRPETLLLDEIQNLENWELIANRLQRQGRKLFITGSNSNLLSRELATHLTGRHLQITVFPFSFKEFIKLQKEELTGPENCTKLFEYAANGGYPEPLVKSIDRKNYLSTLFSSIIYKDIVKRYGIRKPQAIEDLAEFLLSNVGNEYSYQRLSEFTKSRSPHTTQKYVGYLEEAFLLFSLRRFSYKTREQLTANKKIYAIDTGFISAKSTKSTQDIGKLYENIAAIYLKKKETEGKIQLFFWKNAQQEEVDFVIKKGAKITSLIQTCYDISGPDTKKREVRALIKAKQELKCSNLIILTNAYENEEEAEWYGDRAKIKFMPLWKWLLENSSE